jgi:hypothetical protein
MVHALTEVWRALAPGAVLLDIRPYLPFGPLELVERERVRALGRLEEVQFDSDGAAADNAVSEVLRRGLFTLDHADSFYYSGYWDSVGELREYLRDWEDYARLPKRLAGEARKALRAAGPRAWLRLQTYVVVNRLRKRGAAPG